MKKFRRCSQRKIAKHEESNKTVQKYFRGVSTRKAKRISDKRRRAGSDFEVVLRRS